MHITSYWVPDETVIPHNGGIPLPEYYAAVMHMGPFAFPSKEGYCGFGATIYRDQATGRYFSLREITDIGHFTGSNTTTRGVSVIGGGITLKEIHVSSQDPETAREANRHVQSFLSDAFSGSDVLFKILNE